MPTKTIKQKPSTILFLCESNIFLEMYTFYCLQKKKNPHSNIVAQFNYSTKERDGLNGTPVFFVDFKCTVKLI